MFNNLYQNRKLRKVRATLKKINGLKDKMAALSDEALAAKTVEFRKRLAKGETLDDLLVEAFAVVREADKRILGMFPYDVQVMGGIVIHQGNVAEMNTGEGKTLTATLPVYLNSLTGKGTMVITTNEYLAKRDAEEMGQVYRFLGLTVGIPFTGNPLNEYKSKEKKLIYASDVILFISLYNVEISSFVKFFSACCSLLMIIFSLLRINSLPLSVKNNV